MNDIEDRVRRSLAAAGNVGERSMPDGTPARVRARKASKAAVGIVTLVAFVALVGLVVPRGTPGKGPAGGTGDWPVVVVGDPEDAYIAPSTNEHVVGEKHVLTSGTVDGSAFSFVGYESTETSGQTGGGPLPCLQIAGPAIPGSTVDSTGPLPIGVEATTGGVGGYCVPSASVERELEWPPFPDGADLFMRTGAAGGAGVCDQCSTEGQNRWVVITGFVTSRVTRLEVRLEDGTVHDVPVDSWRNDDGLSGFIFFPPSPYLVGDVLAYDSDGGLLARAPLCGPAGSGGHCDVAPTQQLASIPGTTESTHGLTVTYPSDWTPASQVLTPYLTDPREIFALSTYPLQSGGASCAQFPMNAIEDLGPTDALIWLAERQRAAEGTPPRPADLETWMNTGHVDDSPACLSAPKDFVHRSGEFSDAGRVFDLYVAYGSDASLKTVSELWAIVNGMDFANH